MTETKPSFIRFSEKRTRHDSLFYHSTFSAIVFLEIFLSINLLMEQDSNVLMLPFAILVYGLVQILGIVGV
jgi:hypothetical protein